jgi:hypothetical protein
MAMSVFYVTCLNRRRYTIEEVSSTKLVVRRADSGMGDMFGTEIGRARNMNRAYDMIKADCGLTIVIARYRLPHSRYLA